MQHPAAPYYEQGARSEVERICSEHGLRFERDRFGNLLVRLRAAARQRPLVLAAHLDHPGFEIVRRLSPTCLLARFRGGVPDSYFRPGVRVRVMPGAIPGRLGRRKGTQRTFKLHLESPLKSDARFAVWELTDFSIRGRRIYGRSCDDLIGVAAILGTIIELKRSRVPVNILGVISRAEEIGFQGALACAASDVLPKNSLVISLETSRKLPGVRMGQGVIVRVGDRTSVFDPQATRFLTEVASALKQRRRSFQFQRALMSGGTCEATAYQEFGFQTAAVCVALGNYHNCAERNQIKAEFVSISDVSTMLELLIAAAKQTSHYSRFISKLPRRLAKMLREARKKLPKTDVGYESI